MPVILHHWYKRPLANPSWLLQGPPQNPEALWCNQVPHDHQQGGMSLLSPCFIKPTSTCRQKPPHCIEAWLLQHQQNWGALGLWSVRLGQPHIVCLVCGIKHPDYINNSNLRQVPQEGNPLHLLPPSSSFWSLGPWLPVQTTHHSSKLWKPDDLPWEHFYAFMHQLLHFLTVTSHTDIWL